MNRAYKSFEVISDTMQAGYDGYAAGLLCISITGAALRRGEEQHPTHNELVCRRIAIAQFHSKDNILSSHSKNKSIDS